MTKDEAMKLALDALQEALRIDSLKDQRRFELVTAPKAMTALRQALEQPEVWTQKHWTEYERSIAAAENEACAKVCESMRPSEQEYDQRFYTACTLCANAIRARGG